MLAFHDQESGPQHQVPPINFDPKSQEPAEAGRSTDCEVGKSDALQEEIINCFEENIATHE